MKRILATLFLSALLFSPVASAQAPTNDEHKQILELVKEVQAQQTAIAENQAKIDAKLVTVAETVRTAKIYASRGGR